jgi:predicted RNase H-related nuclease YkuK (DUF458 family)
MWRTFGGVPIGSSITDEVERIINEEKQRGNQLKLCIGTDSQVYGTRIEFATVIVFLRAKQGGRMLIDKCTITQKMQLNERLLHEVTLSIETAYSLLEIINFHHITLEVHADINTDPRHKSERTLAEAKGYITGMGFEFKGKPDGFASSSCADKFVN